MIAAHVAGLRRRVMVVEVLVQFGDLELVDLPVEDIPDSTGVHHLTEGARLHFEEPRRVRERYNLFDRLRLKTAGDFRRQFDGEFFCFGSHGITCPP